MKFTDGLWIAKDGFKIETPKEIADIGHSDSGITLFAPYEEQNSKLDSIGCGLLSVKISAPAANMLSVKITNFKGRREAKAFFELNRASVTPVSSENEEAYIYASSLLEARISKDGSWGISFFFSGNYLTSTNLGGMAHIIGPDGRSYIREQLDLSDDEYIYGLGELPGNFIRNGGSYTVWNEDAGIDYGKSSKCVPFILSSNNYGVLVNSTGRVEFEIANDATTGTGESGNFSRAQFSVEGETMEYILIGGASPKHVLNLYTELVGNPALPPAWSFGPWFSTSMLADYDEETIIDTVERYRSQGIPLSVLHFSPFWMKEFEWTSFLWDSERFPNPSQMIRKLHEKGVRVCLWISPYIAQRSPLFREGMEGNYFINTGDGNPWQSDYRQAGAAMIDFSLPVVRAWYQKFLDELIRMGVDSFQLDYGADAPIADPSFGAYASKLGITYKNKFDAESMHNYYAYLFSDTVFEILEKRYGQNNACILSHAGTVGSQKFPFLSLDNTATSYDAMKTVIQSGLNLSISGFPFWSQNIGGLGDDCTPDLFMRWHAAATFAPHANAIGVNIPKDPWNFGADAISEVMLFSKLKLGLMPYIFSSAVESSTMGTPLVRPMLLEFPGDPNTYTLDQQYMLGGNLLVAPITQADGIVRYYVPSGVWTNLLTRERVEGPIWKNEQHDYTSMPILARPGTILVAGTTDETPLYNYMENVTITLFEIPENKEITADVYSADLKNMGLVRVMKKGDRLGLMTQGIVGQIRLLLANVFNVSSVSSGFPELNEWGTMVVYDGDRIEITLMSDGTEQPADQAPEQPEQ
ncbi:MAG: alpha-xylosidase [Clostridiales bacterium]|nr:alpha-xylosidase [Clostridiales bacterium]